MEHYLKMFELFKETPIRGAQMRVAKDAYRLGGQRVDVTFFEANDYGLIHLGGGNQVAKLATWKGVCELKYSSSKR